MSFLIFSENFQKISRANAQIWILLKTFKCKGIFVSSSLDSLISQASRGVFTGSLARSVQELWHIIPSAKKSLRTRDLKGFR